MRVIAALLMALCAERYPPFQTRTFQNTYARLGYPPPPSSPDADEAGLYEYALRFLDQLIAEARSRGLVRPVDRLEAQSLVWMLEHQCAGDRPPDSGERISDGSDRDAEPPDLRALADELLFDVAFLREVETLLDDKRQVIFQGPPGTGKTFVARKLAACLAGSPDRVRLVQFHPSYAYEDFVQGYRPVLAGGQPGFALRSGPLLDMAARARDEPDAWHFLVIDEINRAISPRCSASCTTCWSTATRIWACNTPTSRSPCPPTCTSSAR